MIQTNEGKIVSYLHSFLVLNSMAVTLEADIRRIKPKAVP